MFYNNICQLTNIRIIVTGGLSINNKLIKLSGCAQQDVFAIGLSRT